MKKKLDVKKPKPELREGFETMQFYYQPDESKEVLRYYFKGRVVKFLIAKRTPHKIDGVLGNLLELIIDNPKAVIWYEGFERADGVVFFLGEAEKQTVDKSMRNRAEIYLNRFS